MRAVNDKFADLGTPRRVWAVAAVMGDLDRLMALHDHLASRIMPRDRLVYLGNYLRPGGGRNAAVIEELLAFRAAILARPGMEPCDIVHVRGPAEEAWQKLLRLQFAPVPGRALEDYIAAGVESYLHMYDFSSSDARDIARADSVTITRWTNYLRAAQRQTPGHEPLVCSTRRAAVTLPSRQGGGSLLFVPAGYDSSRTIEDQAENFWNGTASFQLTGRAASRYARIVRGFDPTRGGVSTETGAVTLDGGAGSGGPLVCGCFHANGKLAELIAVGTHGAVDSLATHGHGIKADFAAVQSHPFEPARDSVLAAHI